MMNEPTSPLEDWADQLDQAARWIREADALLILAGAGMGVDSGLPDFRGSQGLWQAYPPLAKLGLDFAAMANPRWFRSNPPLAWGFYGHRLNLYRDVEPHAGYRLLRSWSQNAFVFTSNVDGHFLRAGFLPEQICECHGSLFHLQCQYGCGDSIWPATDLEITVDDATLLAAEPLPTCPRCRQVARPNVLMFNDGAWVAERTAEQEHRLEGWLAQHADARGRLGGLVLVECGAGTAVPRVRWTSEELVGRGAKLIRINPREPDVPTNALGLPLPALATLTAIDQRLNS